MNTLYVLVITLWGLTAQGEWVLVGNQLVLNEPMPKEQCEKLIDKDNAWSLHLTNDYYSIKMDCMPESAQISEEEHREQNNG